MSDRIFGLVLIAVALAFSVSATGIQEGFMSDPVGPKTFPFLISGIISLCALVLIFRPDPEPSWPPLGTALKIGLAVVVLVGYAYALKPMGFLLPTAICAGLISYQIHPRTLTATLTGVGLSVGLFVIFKFGLGLSLFAVPREWMG